MVYSKLNIQNVEVLLHADRKFALYIFARAINSSVVYVVQMLTWYHCCPVLNFPSGYFIAFFQDGGCITEFMTVLAKVACWW